MCGMNHFRMNHVSRFILYLSLDSLSVLKFSYWPLQNENKKRKDPKREEERQNLNGGRFYF